MLIWSRRHSLDHHLATAEDSQVLEGHHTSFILIIKLSRLDFMIHRSFHLSFLLSMLSHLVHCHCLPSETTLVHLATCSWCLTLFTTILLCSAAEALLQVGWQAVNPRPLFPCWTTSHDVYILDVHAGKRQSKKVISIEGYGGKAVWDPSHLFI